jgi:hypothetical protein
MGISRSVASAVLVVALAGCAKPIPPERAAFVGVWEADSMYVVITQDGSVHYKRQKDGRTTSVDGPLKAFDGNDFEVGIGPLSTRFVVNEPPHQEKGRWKMVVDGVELTKADP